MQKPAIDADEALRLLPELLEQAHRGRSVIVSKRGKPYATIVPIGDPRAAPRGPSLPSLKGSGRGLWQSSPRRAIAALRDEWA